MEFELHAPYTPTGDQPQAIEKLVRGLQLGLRSKPFWASLAPEKPSPWPMSSLS